MRKAKRIRLTACDEQKPECPDDTEVAPCCRFRKAEKLEIVGAIDGGTDRSTNAGAAAGTANIAGTGWDQVGPFARENSALQFISEHTFHGVVEWVDPHNPREPGLHHGLLHDICHTERFQ